jgi:recombination protein RecA
MADFTEKQLELAQALEKANKKKVIRSMAEKGFVSSDVKYFSSGDIALDIALSGGFPEGRIIKISGKKGCGKSTILAKAAAIYTRIKKQTIFIMDVENAWTAKWLKDLGVDLTRVHFAVPENLEEGLDILEAVYMIGEYPLIIFDGLSSASPKDEVDISNDSWNAQALKARIANKFFRKLQARQNKILSEGLVPPTFMFANHIFVNPHDKFDKDTTPGGLHQDNASSVILKLTKSAWLREKGEADEEEGDKPTFGFFTQIRIPHTKTGVPNRSWKMGIISEPFAGHSKYDSYHGYSIATVSLRLGIARQSGAWYFVDSLDYKAQGVLSFYEDIVTNKELADHLINEIKRRVKIVSRDPNLEVSFTLDVMLLPHSGVTKEELEALSKLENQREALGDAIPQKKIKKKQAAKKVKKQVKVKK